MLLVVMFLLVNEINEHENFVMYSLLFSHKIVEMLSNAS